MGLIHVVVRAPRPHSKSSGVILWRDNMTYLEFRSAREARARHLSAHLKREYPPRRHFCLRGGGGGGVGVTFLCDFGVSVHEIHFGARSAPRAHFA